MATKKLAILLVLTIALAGRCANAAPATQPTGPRVVLIIRHAEKPESTDGEKDPNLFKITYENGVTSWKDLPQKAMPGDEPGLRGSVWTSIMAGGGSPGFSRGTHHQPGLPPRAIKESSISIQYRRITFYD